MALISKVIPGLFGGVSQQPPALRLDNQCEAMENNFPSLADGLLKRNPAEFVDLLATGSIPTDSYFHFIDRDNTEQYVVIFTGDATTPIQVYALDGTAKTVEYGYWGEAGDFTEDNSKKAYVTEADPISNISALTVADYTFVINSTVVCAKSGIVDVAAPYPNAIIHCKTAVVNSTFSVYVDDVLRATTSTGSTANTQTVTTNLYNQLLTNLGALGTGFRVMKQDNCIVVWNENGNDFVIRATDSWSDGALIAIKQRTGSLNDLPASLPTSMGYKTHAVAITQSYSNITYTITVDSNPVASYILSGRYAPIGKQTIIDNLMSDLATSLPALHANYRWGQSGDGVISIWRIDDVDFTCVASPHGYFQETYLGALHGVSPILIGGVDQDSANIGYYVNFTLEDDDTKKATGAWVECTKDNLDNQFDADTLPHKLIRDTDGVFRFGPILWGKRTAGDEDTCPDPTFIGGTISNMFLFKGRLGFLSGDRVILSRAGGFFELYPYTALEVTDDSPIDISPSTSDVAIMKWASPFKGDILLFSDRDQFLVTSGDQLFGPKTVSIDHNTSFKCSTLAKPVSSAANVYFISPRGNYCSLIEFFMTPNTLSTDASDVTAHAPTYVPSTITSLESSSIFNVVFALAQGDADIYGYRYYWSGEQKAQSAWFRWTFPFSVLAMKIYGSFLYLVARYESQTFLLKVSLESNRTTGQLPHAVHLDALCYVASGSYNAGYTTFTLPYSDTDLTNYAMVKASDASTLNATKINATQMRVAGDYSAVPVYMGHKYTASYTFTEFGVKVPNANLHNPQGRLQLKTLTIGYQNTGIFSLECTPKDRAAYTKDFTNVNIAGDAFGPPDVSSGKARFFIMGRAEGLTVKILNDTPYPSKFYDASWEGVYAIRNRSIG